jgi:large subunit ribosomal protein L21
MGWHTPLIYKPNSAKMHGLAWLIGKSGRLWYPGACVNGPCTLLGAGPHRREFSQEIPMYAVIKTGGKQYRVSAGQKLKIEQIPADIGQEISLDQVLSVGEGETLKIGAPFVEGAAVKATVLAQGRHDKVKIFKMRRRKHYQKRQGHRQNYTEIRIDAVAA